MALIGTELDSFSTALSAPNSVGRMYLTPAAAAALIRSF